MAEVLGIGNALVDILIQLENENILKELGIPKGSMQLVDLAYSRKILDQTGNLPRQLSSGGSAANTIHGLAHCGISCSFMGSVGKDEFGDFFSKDMAKVKIDPLLITTENESGSAIAFISPDSERTFATFLGAAIDLKPEHLEPNVFRNHKHLHIEGYLVQNHGLIEAAVELAKECGLTISIDLASYNVVEANLAFLQKVVKNYINIVFANEEEAKSFTGLDPQNALNAIADICELAVVKIGKDGSMARRGNEIVKVPAIAAMPIDTTGAGDLYAAGFLYGLNKKLPLETCANHGALLAGKVIEVIGAKIPDQTWGYIQKQIC